MASKVCAATHCSEKQTVVCTYTSVTDSSSGEAAGKVFCSSLLPEPLTVVRKDSGNMEAARKSSCQSFSLSWGKGSSSREPAETFPTVCIFPCGEDRLCSRKLPEFFPAATRLPAPFPAEESFPVAGKGSSSKEAVEYYTAKNSSMDRETWLGLVESHAGIRVHTLTLQACLYSPPLIN